MTKKQVITKLDWIYQLLEMNTDQRAAYIADTYGYDYLNDSVGSEFFIKGVICSEVRRLRENI